MFGVSCNPSEPVLHSDEYIVIDTISESRSGVLLYGYHIILEYDNSYYYGHITKYGELINIQKNGEKIYRKENLINNKNKNEKN